jgi:hypothetical protein
MGFKFYMPIVTILLSKVSKDLLEGRSVSVSCHLLFNDGYSPLLLKPSPLYVTYANAVISTLNPDAYLVVENNSSNSHNDNGGDGVNWLSAAIVSKKRKTYVVGRRYTIERGKVTFLDKDPLQLPDPFNVSCRLMELYNELPKDTITHPNFIKLVSAVSGFIHVTKTPYSKVIRQSLH